MVSGGACKNRPSLHIGPMSDKAPNSASLEGKLLIATPAMGDPRFDRTVILMCNHDEEQAFGIVLNRPFGVSSLEALLGQMDIETHEDMADDIVLAGGPVETQRGFVIHSPDYFEKGASIQVLPDFTVTPTKGVLTAMASQTPPARARLALGYAGWGAGQLDAEILQNAWLVAAPSEALVFSQDLDSVWTDALATLGVKPEMLSAIAGHA